jgi:hypothetical protein
MKTLKVEDVYVGGYETFGDVASRLSRFIEEVYDASLRAGLSPSQRRRRTRGRVGKFDRHAVVHGIVLAQPSLDVPCSRVQRAKRRKSCGTCRSNGVTTLMEIPP